MRVRMVAAIRRRRRERDLPCSSPHRARVRTVPRSPSAPRRWRRERGVHVPRALPLHRLIFHDRIAELGGRRVDRVEGEDVQ